ncbi:YidB family protein [Ramlibacter sp. AN1133]|uniref:YidB family protein n=1 Tax=Ramlibacter sp. AN1133 TaxID=3133429 RepID=UPI0030C11741
MNNNPLLGQVLGGLFGQAMRNRGMNRGGLGGATGGGLGGGVGGALGGIALGSVLAGMMRGRGQGRPVGVPGGPHPYGNRTALLVMLLPLAMRWVQRNGGMNAVLDKFRQKGMNRQAQSWMSTGANDPIDGQAVEQVVGQDELRQMAQRLGVPEDQVAQAFAEIMPEMVDKITPDGQLPREADEVLDESTRKLEKEIEDVQFREVQH